MVNCPKCGALIEKGSNFCQECGTKVKTPKNSISTTTSNYEKNKTYALIGIVI